jgi:two-component system KDP operon response regulator KdpE
MTDVLVVDDDEHIRRSLLRLLPAHELTCRAFATVDHALDAIREEPPDIVLLDVGLGRESGLDLLRALRRDDPRRPPVVLMTASRDLFAEISTELGACDDWVTKPWDPQELVARLYLAKRRSVANRAEWSAGATSSSRR